jgi:hypothetical protein
MEARHIKTREFVNERLIETPRGSFTHSIRYLANAWKWSKTRVETFLKLLENEKMIVRKSRQGIGQITILNYDTYQIRRDTDKDSQRTLKGQSKDTERTELNNDKQGETIYSCQYFSVDQDLHDALRTAYGFTDEELMGEYEKTIPWLIANPKNQKKNYNRFLNNWIGRAAKEKSSTQQVSFEEQKLKKEQEKFDRAG